jgi:ABC-type polysaccharide/polyol phosphate transport system ATPase subunit
MSAVIVARDLVKHYRRTSAGFKLRTLKSALVSRSLVGGLAAGETVAALKGVSFEVRRGEAFGVVGGNGSGKSTLLKLMAGILKPTSGSMAVDGKVAALIELGAGFHPEISGRENVFVNGALLGLSRREIESRFESIIEFSGLEDFIDEPVKNYSSGMYVRLGFAVAIHTDPDILLVDEVLAVGDESFAHRCLRRVEELLAAGKTVLFVSHSLGLVEGLCDRVLWLERGEVRGLGSPRHTIDAYRGAVAEEEGRRHQREKEEAEQADAEVLRWGSGAAEIHTCRLLIEGAERYAVSSGDTVTVELEVEAKADLDDVVFGVALSTPRGIEVFGTNTDLAGLAPAAMPAGRGAVRLELRELLLGPGEYLVDVAVHARDGTPYDYRRKAMTFSVTAADRGVGVYFPNHRWQLPSTIDHRSPRRGGEPA